MPAAAALVALLAITGIALRMRKPVAPANRGCDVAAGRASAASSVPATNSVPSPETAPSSGAALSAPRAMDSIAVPPSAPSASSEPRELGSRLPSRPVAHANNALRAGELSRVGVMGGSSGGKSTAAPVKQAMAPKPAPQSSPAMVRGTLQAGNGVGALNGSGGVVGGGTVNSANRDRDGDGSCAAAGHCGSAGETFAGEKSGGGLGAERDSAVVSGGRSSPATVRCENEIACDRISGRDSVASTFCEGEESGREPDDRKPRRSRKCNRRKFHRT